MTDRELLEFAAKAASYQIEGEADKLVVFPGHFSGGFSIFNDMGGSSLWNPLTDDGDALRLVVRLGLRLSVANDLGVVFCTSADRETHQASEGFGADKQAATRRAIVLAAAAIGKEMP